MKLHYYPETDNLPTELTDTPGMKAREIVAGLIGRFRCRRQRCRPRHRSCLAQARSVEGWNDRTAAGERAEWSAGV